MKRSPMTLRGAELLRAEVRKLKTEVRPAIIKALAEARSHGDLSENAEYHAAREQQGFIEGRIAEIEAKLASCEIIDVSRLPNTGRVVFGATVELRDLADGSRVCYQIVGEDEADIKAGLIAITSPIARGLVGKVAGDEVEVVVPGGARRFEIAAVRYE
ncbi:MAG: transcription elongation factor GreA [Steroidobacteraceae bacterium]|nr:transcription elongation factor GreA [Steroidobacteraceae bacterium]MDW8259233.1 transcription elongation factor GreA [Gammaproteobacteria bacterium]